MLTGAPIPVEIDDLDPAGVLACPGAETAEGRAGWAKLELGLQWSVRHPATVETGAAVLGEACLPGLGAGTAPTTAATSSPRTAPPHCRTPQLRAQVPILGA